MTATIGAGLGSGLTLALIGVIAVEFVPTQAGLDLLLITYTYQFKIPLTMAVLLLTSLRARRTLPRVALHAVPAPGITGSSRKEARLPPP